MDKWQKCQIITSIGGVILIPIVVAIIGYYITSAIKEREEHVKYVELAINILKETPKKEDADLKFQTDLRSWAFEVVNLYAPVKLSKTLKEELIKNKPLIIEVPHSGRGKVGGIIPGKIEGAKASKLGGVNIQ